VKKRSRLYRIVQYGHLVCVGVGIKYQNLAGNRFGIRGLMGVILGFKLIFRRVEKEIVIDMSYN